MSRSSTTSRKAGVRKRRSNPHTRTAVRMRRTPPSAPKQVGPRSNAFLFAFQASDRTGLVAAMLLHACRFNTTIESARCVVHNGRFYGTMNACGFTEHVEACELSARASPLFSGTIPRVSIACVEDPKPSMVRRRLTVTCGNQESICEIAELAAKAELSIAYFELKRLEGAHGSEELQADFHIDFHRLSQPQYENFRRGIDARTRNSEIDVLKIVD